eukprot:TRINITY_DN13546_c0_g1_i1.p1 TRINITY_DN13546_c0_g1~~TRINITY_DN13546_c0_g1_i1.p1  ORF type:complete len:350 (-),score=57.56 TRINITY_DN13546_c0_g1_i1:188-1237(-)
MSSLQMPFEYPAMDAWADLVFCALPEPTQRCSAFEEMSADIVHDALNSFDTIEMMIHDTTSTPSSPMEMCHDRTGTISPDSAQSALDALWSDCFIAAPIPEDAVVPNFEPFPVGAASSGVTTGDHCAPIHVSVHAVQRFVDLHAEPTLPAIYDLAGHSLQIPTTHFASRNQSGASQKTRFVTLPNVACHPLVQQRGVQTTITLCDALCADATFNCIRVTDVAPAVLQPFGLVSRGCMTFTDSPWHVYLVSTDFQCEPALVNIPGGGAHVRVLIIGFKKSGATIFVMAHHARTDQVHVCLALTPYNKQVPVNMARRNKQRMDAGLPRPVAATTKTSARGKRSACDADLDY